MAKKKRKPLTRQIEPSDVVEEAAETVEEAPKKKSFLAGLAEKVAPVAKVVIPQVAGLIPGVGPILKGVLSTLNDDEWFGEFKSGGATFNELLGDIPLAPGSDKSRNISGAILLHEVGILGEGSTPMNQQYSDMLLPTILAYVRDKTGDVLVSAESDYWQAFFVSSCLVALYYTLEKYIELQHDLPLNIPDLSAVCDILAPADYAAFVGIRDSLRDYLRVTIGLPYAWMEYLRWRFGTTFLSDNTGRAGLVFYDYNLRRVLQGTSWVRGGLSPTALSTVIAGMKAQLAATSRAVADLHLAYKEHQVRYSVEGRHYDEKEYNLRCNTFNYNAQTYTKDEGGNNLSNWPAMPGPLLYMDSRLDSSAAFQAITLSTDTRDIFAPLHVTGQYVFWYVKASYTIPYGYMGPGNTPGTDNITIPAGWSFSPAWDEASTKTRAMSINLVFPGVEYVNGPNIYAAKMYSMYAGSRFDSVDATAGARQTAVRDCYTFYFGQLVLDSMQAHKAQATAHFLKTSSSSCEFVYVGKPLAYDMALVTWSQIESTQRMAMRNLIRGNYTHKVNPSTNPVVTEPVNDLVEVVADEMVKAAE